MHLIKYFSEFMCKITLLNKGCGYIGELNKLWKYCNFSYVVFLAKCSDDCRMVILVLTDSTIGKLLI